MLEKIKIINFKWIQKKEIFFWNGFNVIIWNNWSWKTNILEAISTLFLNNFYSNNDKDLILKWENLFFLEWDFFVNGIKNTLSFSYDFLLNKKNILLNKKKVTKKVLLQNILKVSFFLPITMNLFYLWPKYRRDFLDNVLFNSFENYHTLVKEYDLVLKNRNKVLKNISDWNSKKEEIIFWDEKFIFLATKITEYRLNLVQFIKENLQTNLEIFWVKVWNIDFIYKTKIDILDINWSIKKYLDKNLERDIILWKTHIWPHIDDFDVIVNETELIKFASRGETKSIILCLKLLEIEFIEKITWTKPLLLIDDFKSELDETHINILLNKLSWIQTIISSISNIEKINENNYFI